ncbi:Glutathione S-transferase 1 [Eumeta japonica]|uniref:Glutathione S-transferase 1 n=1 Tax=Eumeta variegata TaxID=151549 RepID=A0A4C1VMG6_EUMVA|nr:Glutathione S-transferase 1 [Eumeta japonica]
MLVIEIPSFSSFRHRQYPQVFGGAPADAEKKKKVEEALGFLNSFLEGHVYAVGSDLTLADLSLIATVSTMEASDVDFKAYPNVKRWYELVKSTAPNYEKANGEGVQATIDMVASLKKTEL